MTLATDGPIFIFAGDWLRCIAVASSMLWLRELCKVTTSELGSENTCLSRVITLFQVLPFHRTLVMGVGWGVWADVF